MFYIQRISFYISPMEIFEVYLQQNGLWSENIGTDVFQCGVVSGRLQTVQLVYCIIEGTCKFCMFPADAYWCLLVS